MEVTFWTFFLIGVSMLFKDLAYVAAEFLVSRNRGVAAALCDIAGDIASLFTIGIGGVTVAHHGLSLDTIYVCVAIAIGSLLGTLGGLRLGQKINGESPEVVKLLSPLPARLTTRTPPPPTVPALTAEERRLLMTPDASGLTLFDRQRCTDCGGVHTTACPRVKARTGDGVEYFGWGEWPTDNIIWPEQIFEEEETIQ